MASWDWERFGDDIRRTVQDAVDSRNYEKLNQTINETIYRAMDGIGKGVRNAGDAVNRNMQDMARQRGRGRKAYRRPYPGQYRSPYEDQNGRPYEGQYGSGSRAEYRYNAGNRQNPALYTATGGAKAGGIIMAAAGYVLGVLLLVGLPVFVIRELATGSFDIIFQILFGSGALLLAGSAVLAGAGHRFLGRVKRFEAYIEGMQGKEYGDIKALAELVKKSPKYVAKDLEKMIRKGWFRQGHLDRQKTCLMVTDNAYRQYEELMERMEEQKRREQEEGRSQKDKPQKDESSENADPRVRDIIRTGDEYIKKIHECNDAIPGAEISAKISRMETLVDRIFDRVEQNPNCVPEIRRLMEYYLPTTVKLLEAYEELDSQPVQGENIQSSKQEIEKTLDTLNVAFEKLLDSLFQDTAWDVSSDISVLKTMLAQEGLTEDDF